MKRIVFALLVLAGFVFGVYHLKRGLATQPVIVKICEFNTGGLNYLPLEGDVPSALPLEGIPNGTRLAVVYEVQTLGLRVLSKPSYFRRFPASLRLGEPVNRYSSVNPSIVSNSTSSITIDIMNPDFRLFKGEIKILGIDKHGAIKIGYEDRINFILPNQGWTLLLISDGLELISVEPGPEWERQITEAYSKGATISRIDIKNLGRTNQQWGTAAYE